MPWTLDLPFDRPPLTENQRLHHMAKARLTKQVRRAASFLARSQRIPPLGTCTVHLVWHVNTKHRRDADNLAPTLKAACDGLVDAGLVPDDTPALMDKRMPEIEYRPGQPAALQLLITEGIDR
jgi:crossover junction endodeoxyribonuclease RusA